MQTLKQIKAIFANEMYSWCSEQDLEHWELNKMKQAYIDELSNCNPEWDVENMMWESWYIRWYEIALKRMFTHFNIISSKEFSYRPLISFTASQLADMFKTLLHK